MNVCGHDTLPSHPLERKSVCLLEKDVLQRQNEECGTLSQK